MTTEPITGRKNPLMTHLRKLASSSACRRESGEFLCDSPKLLAEALRWQAEVTAVVYTEGMEMPHELPGRVVCVPPDVMQSVSPMEAPQGVLFTCRATPLALPPVLPGRHYVVLDGVQDPGNVGTVLRTADAFECDGMFLLPGCADLYNPKTVRATMGAVFRRPVWVCEPEELKALLQKSGIPLYGAALRDDTRDARALCYEKAAVAIGSEGKGLSQAVLALCDCTMKIPMSPRCESLNAAAAAAVLLWEMYR